MPKKRRRAAHLQGLPTKSFVDTWQQMVARYGTGSAWPIGETHLGSLPDMTRPEPESALPTGIVDAIPGERSPAGLFGVNPGARPFPMAGIPHVAVRGTSRTLDASSLSDWEPGEAGRFSRYGQQELSTDEAMEQERLRRAMQEYIARLRARREAKMKEVQMLKKIQMPNQWR